MGTNIQLLTITLLSLLKYINSDYVIGCYYTVIFIYYKNKNFSRLHLFKNWSQHRKEEVKFIPKSINPKLCTHAYFAFANIDIEKWTIMPFEKNDISDNPKLPVIPPKKINFLFENVLNF